LQRPLPLDEGGLFLGEGDRMKVGAAMHRGVIACAPDYSGVTAARIMASHRIHAVVVEVEGRTPRIVTDGDVASALYDGRLAATTAAEIARPCPILTREDTLDRAVALMHELRATHAVVVDHPRSQRPIGVLSVLDIANALERDRASVDGRSPIRAAPDAAVAGRDET
jgi:CBS domain-containing protein